jgi:hypothetical protein
MSASAASKAAGKLDAIRNMRRAVRSGLRDGVTMTTLQALAPVLKTDVAWLADGDGPQDAQRGTLSDLALTSAEFEDLGRACFLWMQQNVGDADVFKMIEELLEVVRRRHGNVDPRYVDFVRSRFLCK